MKQKNACRKLLQILAVLFAFISMIGLSQLTSLAAWNGLYLPVINRYWPGEPYFRSPLLITEILYNSTGQEPDSEWIELYNRGVESINLEAFKIGDSETQGDMEGMYNFPKKASIKPGQAIVIANQALTFSQKFGFIPDFELSDTDQSVPDMVKYRPWASGSMNLNNNDDEILLLNKDNTLLDAVSWGNSSFAFMPPISLVEEGHSLERHPADLDRNHSMDWRDQIDPHPGKVDLIPLTPIPTNPPDPPQPSCVNAELLISEVMSDPANVGEPDGEWYEIFNWGDATLNLECARLGDEETFGGGEGMLAFPPGSTLPPGGVIVIANKGTEFFSKYGEKPDYEVNDSDAEVLDMLKFESWSDGSVNLSNNGDEVLLLDETDSLIDAVSWGSSTFAFDPSIPKVVEGHSMERRPASQDTDSVTDWIEQINPDPGNIALDPPIPSPPPTHTPTPPTMDLVINEIHADPHSDLGDANNDGDVDVNDDEFIEIVNTSPDVIDLSGWRLNDALEIRHIFPAGSMIEPACGVLIFGGGEPDGDFGYSLVQVASSGLLGFNDHGDIIYLYDASTVLVTSYVFGVEGGDDQSITRVPDITGEDPLKKHTTAPGSEGSLFSPGTKVDGESFSGCSD